MEPRTVCQPKPGVVMRSLRRHPRHADLTVPQRSNPTSDSFMQLGRSEVKARRWILMHGAAGLTPETERIARKLTQRFPETPFGEILAARIVFQSVAETSRYFRGERAATPYEESQLQIARANTAERLQVNLTAQTAADTFLDLVDTAARSFTGTRVAGEDNFVIRLPKDAHPRLAKGAVVCFRHLLTLQRLRSDDSPFTAEDHKLTLSELDAASGEYILSPLHVPNIPMDTIFLSGLLVVNAV